MKKIMILISFYFLATNLYASCGNGSCDDGFCDYNQTACQCTDPMCNKPMYSDCISRGYCCEAFGNIGAR